MSGADMAHLAIYLIYASYPFAVNALQFVGRSHRTVEKNWTK